MSPRNKTLRKVVNPPLIKGFKPFGAEPGKGNADPVVLLFEEYEALRLCDYDNCNQLKASGMMGVSRPTFTRIYASALQKIATAFVEGRTISITGGKVYFDSDWYNCKSCHCHFNNPDRDRKIESCPLCGSLEIIGYDFDFAGTEQHKEKRCKDSCICPDCGYMQEHVPGSPCSSEHCPRCGAHLIRKG
jgi:uncharacterized protein